MAIISRFPGGGGSSGNYPYNVASFSASALDDSVTLTWTDPTDSAWKGTMIRRKTGGYPTSETDGVLVVNSTTQNQYESVGFVDDDLADGTTYYYQAFPYSDDGYCNNEENRVSATPTYIYPSALTAFSITRGDAQATLNFTLPANASGVKMVYKTKSYPTSQTDGTVITDASSGGTVSSYTVGSLTNDVTYYFRAFPFNSYGRYNSATTGNQATVTPQALPAQDTLENMSWADINTVAAAGQAAEYWSVGDTKTITFESAVLGSTSIVVEIMGFEYDDLADESGKAPITFGMVDCFTTTQQMNSSDTNAEGWGSCALRTTLINTVLPELEDVIGTDVIKPVSKRTSAGSQSTTINTTTDSVWLLSEYEIFGATTNSVAGEKPTDKSICYPAFTDAASRIKKTGASAAYWWGRSPRASDSTSFCAVSSSGTANYGYASGSNGVAVGFCI